MSITNRKIAEIAGVAPSTVTKVFQNSPEVSRETSERIRKIAEEYGWTPRKYKRIGGEYSKHISILVPELISVMYASVVSVAVKELKKKGIEPDIHIVGFKNDDINALVDKIISEDIADGLLIINTLTYSKVKPRIPILYFTTHSCGTRNISNNASFVMCEDFGITAILDYLVDLGHRNIAFISESNTNVKLSSFKAMMSKKGLNVTDMSYYVSNRRFEEVGYEAVNYYIEYARSHPNFVFPTAFIGAYDEIALGAMCALANAGIKIPDEVSVVGMNNVNSSLYGHKPLTTINYHLEEQMKIAVHSLIEKVNDPELNVKKTVEIPYELIVRESTAAPRTVNSIKL